jgi:hypothetical protein
MKQTKDILYAIFDNVLKAGTFVILVIRLIRTSIRMMSQNSHAKHINWYKPYKGVKIKGPKSPIRKDIKASPPDTYIIGTTIFFILSYRLEYKFISALYSHPKKGA